MLKFILRCSCIVCRVDTTVQSLSAHLNKHQPKANCLWCREPLYKSGVRFCNHSCAASFLNRKRGHKPRPPKDPRSRHQKWVDSWLSGQIRMEDTYYGPDNAPSTFIRRYLTDKSGNRCEKCGWNEVNMRTGKVPLQINHIDGDSTNNLPNNVELICPNCHSLTPTYGRHGKGRKKRYILRD